MSTMSNINFQRICRSWLKSPNNVYHDQGFNEDSIRFVSVKVGVDDVIWTPIVQLKSFQVGARKVNFTASKSNNDMDVCVKTTKPTENAFKIKLITGIIEGFNSTMKLPLEGTGYAGELGDFFTFDPSKAEPEILHDSITLSASVTKKYSSSGDSAHVCFKEKEYSAKFDCCVKVTGEMLVTSFEGGSLQHSIVEIIKDHKSEDANKFPMLRISPDNEVQIKMAGEVELRWGYEQNMHVE